MQHPARLGRVDEHDGVAAIKPGTPQNYGRISPDIPCGDATRA
jgi:hypothetical protein